MSAAGKWTRLAEAARAVEDLDTVHGRKCAFKWDVTALCDCRKGELWRALAALTPADVALADGAEELADFVAARLHEAWCSCIYCPAARAALAKAGRS